MVRTQIQLSEKQAKALKKLAARRNVSVAELIRQAVDVQLHTAGWGWLWAGGVEHWLTKQVGVYGETGRLQIKGSDTRGGEGTISDTATYIFIGARVRIPSFF